MGDYHTVASLNLAAEDTLTGIFLRVENLGRARELPQTLVHSGSLDHATVLSNISKEHGETAVLGVSVFEVTDATVGTVGVKLAPLRVLATHLGRELATGCSLVYTVCLRINTCFCYIVFLHLLAKSLAIHTDSGTIYETALVELAEYAEDTAGTTALLHTVLLGVGSELA